MSLSRRSLLSGLAASVFSGPAFAEALTCGPAEYRRFGFGKPDECIPFSAEVQALMELADGEPEPQLQTPVEPVVKNTRPRQRTKQPQHHAMPKTAKPATPKKLATPEIWTMPTKGVRYIHATSRFDSKTHRVPYFADGHYIDDNSGDVNQLLCDWRTGATIDMKRAVLNFQWRLRDVLEVDEPWFIISAYRSLQTNAALRSASNGGVAKQSLHMAGMALDVRLSSRSPVQIFRAAYALGMGGTAPYSGSNFTHIDCGRRRTWGEGLQYI